MSMYVQTWLEEVVFDPIERSGGGAGVRLMELGMN